MKKKHNEGFTLVEVMVAIVILGIFVVPTCSSLVLSFQMNQKTAQMVKAQQAVSSAVETLKATGITEAKPSIDGVDVTCQKTNPSDLYYTVIVTSDLENIPDISVTTVIRDMNKLKDTDIEIPDATEETEPAATEESGGDS